MGRGPLVGYGQRLGTPELQEDINLWKIEPRLHELIIASLQGNSKKLQDQLGEAKREALTSTTSLHPVLKRKIKSHSKYSTYFIILAW